MNTKIIRIDMEKELDAQLLNAAEILKNGGVVAIPTETVYGLAANALEETASKKIYEAKGRPSDNPLIAHISCMDELPALVSEIPEAGQKLAEKYWPGPLTMVFPKAKIVPYGTTGGLETVAVRMPSHPIANRLIKLAGIPLAAPSANTSGRPSPTKADHVIEDMDGKIDMIIDGGEVGIGLESTIVDVSGEIPMLLRPGAITIEMLRETLGRVDIDPAIMGPMSADMKPKAPGMKYRHYAPKAEMTLVEGEMEKVVEFINREAKAALAEGKKVGIICTEESRAYYQDGILEVIGSREHEETVAHNLFSVLRDFDDRQVDCIFSESFSKDRLGQAIMNRLCKAAGYHIVNV
ncbi:MAG: threonylcarbamoyl-AMP synthase [Lachnospiraceae bacterium]|nr:threonylcarbamoyl-AMP synthase [Lachnospiraceae bacterium]